VDLKDKQRYYAQCRDEPLEPNDERNLDIDQCPAAPRGRGWVGRLAEPISLSPRVPVQLFFSALPGSGKSTELRRLKALLSSPPNNLLVALVDAVNELDLTGTIDAFDILAVLVHRTEELILEREGKNAAAALHDGYLKRLWNWLQTTDAELTQAQFSIPEAASLTVEMKMRPALRERLRQNVANHLPRFLQEIREEFRLLEGRAKKCGHAGLVVILDSLEKLRGPTTTYDQVLASAEKLFAGGAPYLALPVHSVLTIPPAVYARLATLQVDFMPVVKVRNQDGKLCQEGIDVMRELVRLRIPDHALQEILGQEQCEPRITEVIVQSGGYPRDVVNVLRRLIETPAYPVSDKAFASWLNEQKERYRIVVTQDDYPWLRHVAKSKELDIKSDAHRATADRALQNHIVLRYCNEKTWWDLHPAVAQIPGIAP